MLRRRLPRYPASVPAGVLRCEGEGLVEPESALVQAHLNIGQHQPVEEADSGLGEPQIGERMLLRAELDTVRFRRDMHDQRRQRACRAAHRRASLTTTGPSSRFLRRHLEDAVDQRGASALAHGEPLGSASAGSCNPLRSDAVDEHGDCVLGAPEPTPGLVVRAAPRRRRPPPRRDRPVGRARARTPRASHAALAGSRLPRSGHVDQEPAATRDDVDPAPAREQASKVDARPLTLSIRTTARARGRAPRPRPRSRHPSRWSTRSSGSRGEDPPGRSPLHRARRRSNRGRGRPVRHGHRVSESGQSMSFHSTSAGSGSIRSRTCVSA